MGITKMINLYYHSLFLYFQLQIMFYSLILLLVFFDFLYKFCKTNKKSKDIQKYQYKQKEAFVNNYICTKNTQQKLDEYKSTDIQIQIVIIYSNIDMQRKTYKVIELEDKYIDHSSDYPYVQSCHKDKSVLFSLRTAKTYRYQPILIIDSYERDKMVLPLIVGRNIDKCENCEILKGNFNQDGGWSCEYTLKQPGLMHYQLVFVDYGGTVIRDLGCFDCILKVQNRVELRKLRKQTVFPRCIGTIQDWQAFFKRQLQLGYNSFHFAPIQQTGFSKSYYSIYDQLELASDVFSGDNAQRYKQLQSFLLKFQKQGVIFFIDIVLNHTSFDSEWIKQDVSAVFTVQNTPMLASAYQLDIALRNWGNQIKSNFGDSDIAMDNDQFQQIKNQLTQLVQNLKLYEFFQVKETIIKEFLDSLPPRAPSQNIFAKDPSEVVLEFLEQNCSGLGEGRGIIHVKNLGQRWKDLDCAYQQNDVKYGIKKFNNKWKKIIKNQWQKQIINNILGEIRYHYMEAKNRTYDDELPFINPYFSHVHTKKGQIVPALNNGWVMGADTSENLVTTKNFYYLRRKVSVWGDLIRIRYGDGPEDSPAWNHMRKYVQTMAKHFDGFRLDNLHGTQLNLAQWMIKQARKIKPQIIIFAELFCSTQREKAIFVRTSGVNSTLFELKHHLSGPQFLGLFYQSMGNQGKYTGSISPHFDRPDGNRVKYCKRKKPIPLIYDLTHDNKTYEQCGETVKKTPICIITEFSGAFVGSTKGFDQFYSKKIFVTQTNALYLQDQPKKVTNHKFEKSKKKIIFPSTNSRDNVEIFGSWNGWAFGGKMQFKGKLGFEIDLQLAGGTYEYKFKVNGQWISDERKMINGNGNHQFSIIGQETRFVHHNLEMLRKKGAESREKFFAYMEYYAYCENDIIILLREKKHTRQSVCIIVNLSNSVQSFNNPIKLPGKVSKGDVWIQSEYAQNQGLTTDVEIVNHSNINEYFDCFFDQKDQKDILLVNNLPPGFGCIIQCKKTEVIVEALKSIRQLRDCPIKLPPLGPLDYNLIMYGVEPEEIARFNATNYYIPSEKKKLIFGGFGGIISELQRAKRNNLLSIGLYDNIREGNWLLDYYVSRLKRYKHLGEFTDLVERYFECLKQIPQYLRPKYFTDFVYKIYKSLQEQISHGSKNRFERKLLLATTQFISSFQTQNPAFKVTMSAGLPHFTVGWTRCWGRDTFMCNQLLLLYPNIYRDTILQFAATLRHGMIPNLLDFGVNPRYNCRDACWWFIRGIKEYARHTKDYSIFKTKVNMIFLSNDPLQHRQKLKRGEKKVMLIQEIVHNIFQSHADGISYREWNAGYQIDSNMSSEGFTVHLNVHEDTGFIVGGNAYNCLTWMDKMGSSGRAGNKGYPATPRAGAPVQLTALLYHCLDSYDKLNKQGHYSFNQVKFAKLDISYQYWAKRIKDNFEFCYYIDEKSQKTKYQHIYKDVCFPPPGLFYEQFRLRPNALVALALTPQIINPDHALAFLKNVQKQLISQFSIGVSTLGQAHDSLYVPFYDNSDDSIDIKVAHGFSYHNGPEWVWLYGFYVKAKCNFNKGLKRNQLFALLQNHARYLYSNDWGSLPELTNKNGQLNNFSCQSQAWSVSSMLLAINSINQYLPPSERSILPPIEQPKQTKEVKEVKEEKTK